MTPATCVDKAWSIPFGGHNSPYQRRLAGFTGERRGGQTEAGSADGSARAAGGFLVGRSA